MTTVVSILTEALDELKIRRASASQPFVVRELYLAITAVEDAIMRSNRAFSILADRPTADVEAGLISENIQGTASWPVVGGQA